MTYKNHKMEDCLKYIKNTTDEKHAIAVYNCSIMLFDELVSWHKYGKKERILLSCASLLHDIGYSISSSEHHKASRDLILSSKSLPFDKEEREIIAMIARYHRKSLPKDSHKIYRNFSEKDKRRVSVLASILRIADGLDRTHTSTIKKIKVRITDKEIHINIKASLSALLECEYARKKSDLLEKVSEKKVIVAIVK